LYAIAESFSLPQSWSAIVSLPATGTKTREFFMLKAVIIFLMLAVIVSLFSGLFFLIRDGGKTNRVVNSLAVRVTLSVLLLAVILLSLWQGSLTLHPTP
jgi:uncharacterized RDD family membrane protein YckC